MRKLNELGIGPFRPGRQPNGGHIKSNDLMGPTSNADSVAAQRLQYNVGNYDYEENDTLEDDLEDTILECRVYKHGKFCLIETLDNLNEFPNYAGNFEHMMKKISNSAKDRKSDIQEDEDPLEEFSGAAAGGGGPAVPLGYTAKGRPETPAQRRKRQRFNITKSYPYTKLANPPKSTKRRRRKK